MAEGAVGLEGFGRVSGLAQHRATLLTQAVPPVALNPNSIQLFIAGSR